MTRNLTGIGLLALATAVTAACGERSASATHDGSQSEDGRIYSDPVPGPSGEIRVLLLHDMEGLAGQSDPRTFSYANRELYPTAQQLLIDDVNAVIDGLFAGGATSVDVVDGHGSGNQAPDILSDQLDPRARQVFRDEPFRQYVDLVEPRAYDAVAVVGMHAKTGSRGFASHTYTLGIEFRMNGHSITETELVAYSFGRAGIPVIFASGDDRLGADLETMPWIEYATVKRATSASTAEPRPLEEARAELRSKAQRAVERLGEMRVVALEQPVQAALRAVPPASLAVLDGVPGIDYDDQTASFTAPDFGAAYDGLIALVTVARTGYASVLQETLREHPAGTEILEINRMKLFDRWLDYESGRWTPPEPTPPAPRRYHGAN
jgi:D-amino peptidase